MNLSVIVPAHDAAAHIERSLMSLARQTTRDFELIVIDDGSTDQTAIIAGQILAEVGFDCARVVPVRHGGVSAARNRGMAEASGTYILFLDSDDYLERDLIETVSICAGQTIPDILAWGWEVVDTTGARLGGGYLVGASVETSDMSGVAALRRRVIDRSLRTWTASAAYKRTFVLEHAIQFTEGCNCGEDLEFTYKALPRANLVRLINRTLSYYVQRPGSTTNRSDVARFQSVGALKRAHMDLASSQNPDVRDIAVAFGRTKLTRNYFYTLESCLIHQDEPDVAGLLCAIEHEHLGINEEIRQMVSVSMASAQVVPYEQELFLISPESWWQHVSAGHGVG